RANPYTRCPVATDLSPRRWARASAARTAVTAFGEKPCRTGSVSVATAEESKSTRARTTRPLFGISHRGHARETGPVPRAHAESRLRTTWPFLSRATRAAGPMPWPSPHATRVVRGAQERGALRTGEGLHRRARGADPVARRADRPRRVGPQAFRGARLARRPSDETVRPCVAPAVPAAGARPRRSAGARRRSR